MVLIVDCRINCFAIISNAVLINIATTRRENAVGSSRAQLENWRDLEVPRKVKDTRQDEAMSLIFGGWPEIIRIEFDERVLRRQTKIRGGAKPGLRFREGVMRVQLEFVRVALLECYGEGVITRPTIGLGHRNSSERRCGAESLNQLCCVCSKCRR